MKRKKTDLIMKKFLIFLMILTFGAGINLQASKPIPSYKAQINKENFKEKHHPTDNSKLGEKGRRYMMVVAQVAGPSRTPVYIWIYSLDGRNVQGPYIIYGDGDISATIDDREWGSYIQCTDKCTVSVWTSSDPQGLDPSGTENL
jgi:hypothetical protein